MKKFLHILKSSSDTHAILMIEELSRSDPDRTKVVLIQDAVKYIPTWKAKTYILNGKSDKPLPPDQNGLEAIDYEKLVDLMFEADSIVSW